MCHTVITEYNPTCNFPGCGEPAVTTEEVNKTVCEYVSTDWQKLETEREQLSNDMRFYKISHTGDNKPNFPSWQRELDKMDQKLQRKEALKKQCEDQRPDRPFREKMYGCKTHNVAVMNAQHAREAAHGHRGRGRGRGRPGRSYGGISGTTRGAGAFAPVGQGSTSQPTNGGSSRGASRAGAPPPVAPASFSQTTNSGSSRGASRAGAPPPVAPASFSQPTNSGTGRGASATTKGADASVRGNSRGSRGARGGRGRGRGRGQAPRPPVDEPSLNAAQIAGQQTPMQNARLATQTRRARGGGPMIRGRGADWRGSY